VREIIGGPNVFNSVRSRIKTEIKIRILQLQVVFEYAHLVVIEAPDYVMLEGARDPEVAPTTGIANDIIDFNA
jgi:hypothetical protein